MATTPQFAYVISSGNPDGSDYTVHAVVLDEVEAHEIAARWTVERPSGDPPFYADRIRLLAKDTATRSPYGRRQ
jgi:hypothetical protein